MAELRDDTDIREIVRERYAAAANRIAEGTTSGLRLRPGRRSRRSVCWRRRLCASTDPRR